MFAPSFLASHRTQYTAVSSSLKRYISSQNSYNKSIVDLLNNCKDNEESLLPRNGYRIRAFSNAIKVISGVEHPLKKAYQVLELPGIGPNIKKRIIEYLDQQPDAARDPQEQDDALKRRAMAELQRVPGIGLIKSRQLVEAGCMTIADLSSRRFASKLQPSQVVGLTFMEHIQKPVTYTETTNVVEFCSEMLSSKYEVITVGDHRRGADTSPEVDIMLLHPDFVHIPLPELPKQDISELKRLVNKSERQAYLSKHAKSQNRLFSDVIPALEDSGLVVATTNTGVRMWRGVIRLPGQGGSWGTRSERLDAIRGRSGEYRFMTIHLVPVKSKGAALLSLTGDKAFNRDIRLKAAQLGLYLNAHGLWKWHYNGTESSETQDSVAQGTKAGGYWGLVKAHTEEEILAELGMAFIPPARRNYSFLSTHIALSRRKKFQV